MSRRPHLFAEKAAAFREFRHFFQRGIHKADFASNRRLVGKGRRCRRPATSEAVQGHLEQGHLGGRPRGHTGVVEAEDGGRGAVGANHGRGRPQSVDRTHAL